jgi:hypothetical protein
MIDIVLLGLAISGIKIPKARAIKRAGEAQAFCRQPRRRPGAAHPSLSDLRLFRKSGGAGSGLNGKMSEYHAAVGIAALDKWDEASSKLEQIPVEFTYNLRA